jgi:hypothetical protein
MLEAFSRAVASGSGDANVMSGAVDLLGVKAAGLIPVFQDVGANGIGALAASMQEAGRIMSDDVINKLAAADLKIAKFWDGIKNYASRALAWIIEGVERLGNALARWKGGETLESSWSNAGKDIAAERDRLAKEAAGKRASAITSVRDVGAEKAVADAARKAADEQRRTAEDVAREKERRADVLGNASFANEQRALEQAGRTVEARARDLIRQLESAGAKATDAERQQALTLAREQVALEGKRDAGENIAGAAMVEPATNALERIGAVFGGATGIGANPQRDALDVARKGVDVAQEQLAVLRRIETKGSGEVTLQ